MSESSRVLNSLQNIFSGSRPLIKKLLGWTVVEGDDKASEKAIEHLVKKLKKNPVALQALERAISTPGVPSECICIPRSKDGRLQVCHRKGLPHVIYCRLWRWPDLQSPHELKPINTCEHPFSKKDDFEVCVNPYHYVRVDTKMIVAPVKVPVQPTVDHHIPTEYPTNNMMGQTSFVYSPMASPADSGITCSSNSTMEGERTTSVPYPEEPGWAALAYYELNTRVGERFQCLSTQNIITVDGYTNPANDSDRFCLGGLSNIHRNAVIENVRRHIGRGISLHYVAGNVYLDNHSDNSVFIQSDNLNWKLGHKLLSVMKVESGVSAEIFDVQNFRKTVQATVPYGYEAIYGLIRMCTIRLSFVKGWGSDYPRKDITATPCWMEIHLNNPLKFIDDIIKRMQPPASFISSVS